MLSAPLLLALVGCDTSTGPVVPPSGSKPATAPPAAPSEAPKDGKRALNASEAQADGPPTRATP